MITTIALSWRCKWEFMGFRCHRNKLLWINRCTVGQVNSEVCMLVSKVKFVCGCICNKAQSVWVPAWRREVTLRNRPAVSSERETWPQRKHSFVFEWSLLSFSSIALVHISGRYYGSKTRAPAGWEKAYGSCIGNSVDDQMHYWSTAWNIGMNYWKDNPSASEWGKPGVREADSRAVFVVKMRFVSTACSYLRTSKQTHSLVTSTVFLTVSFFSPSASPAPSLLNLLLSSPWPICMLL